MEEIEEMVGDSFGQEGVEVLSDIFSSDKNILRVNLLLQKKKGNQ